ncbi:multidrug efflux RND transporter permease subunit [Mesoterricola silvestris]|uniref:Multidrug resistance protein MdtC n=1 Tax=Mesoterricola silvestris TaxID=2927979 RepID=A0AA48GUF6_9BACT|nr:multidrug efflux RND transporter permease subunit [Mesoterricola silvestris]BDU74267.1 multidrug resistance protein MdtC [Mesoterricola silvestris]
MSISAPFIRRPIATSLLTIAIALAGSLAFKFLPVSPLPQVEFPTIQVSAGLPGASPETMASSVATPLERQFGRIAGITEMTSNSSLGSTNITLQFDLNRNIDAAARDVQSAINAARGQLPANLPNNPRYRKVNPADAPVMLFALTSDIVPRQNMYDIASKVLQQRLSQVPGVGQVFVWGGALPAVRVEVDPDALHARGLGLEDVRLVLLQANVNQPKGSLVDGDKTFIINTSDQLLKAKDYGELVIAFKGGTALRVKDVARVTDSVEDLRNDGLTNGRPSVSMAVFRQPGANIIDTVDAVRALEPQLKASLPPSVNFDEVLDATQTIRASVKDVERTLMISVGLVILVVFIFLRDWRSTLIPSVAVPVSLVGTFGVMYLLGYSVDNLSLMALTVATGFVVDDAIVVVENITRHLEGGLAPYEAAMEGAREIGFTVLSISISLCAVFIPILLMGGIVGRLFREFAVTLSVAILMSMAVSLTTTPMMCARLLRPSSEAHHGRLFNASERWFKAVLGAYERSLGWVLRHKRVTMGAALATAASTVLLYIFVPKGFFPQQDTGRIMGAIQADQSISFQAMKGRLREFVTIVKADPAVSAVSGSVGGGGTTNTGRVFVALKPMDQRDVTADQIINRLRGKLSKVAGANLYLQPVQDIRIGGRGGNAQFQYTLQGDESRELFQWAPRVFEKMRGIKELADVNTDQQNQGLQASVVVDRPTAARLGVTSQMIDNTLYDAFGQRPVSTMYTDLIQYHVVLEVAPDYWQNPDSLDKIYVHASTGAMVPLSAFAKFQRETTLLAVAHQGQLPSVTITFNLAPGVAIGDAVKAIEKAQEQIRLPATIRGNFMGTAQAFKASLANEPILVLAAFLAVYLLLGILYESLIHPLTILSTLPSAGVGALVALLLCGTELSFIAFIGIILLIGIVKKNAILMIDFAIEAERREGLTTEEAIFQACLLRFRPITMTTMAALLGGLPLALGRGAGAELRRPLGIAIVGGLIVSQVLTIYTTPVIYIYMARFSRWFVEVRGRALGRLRGTPALES